MKGVILAAGVGKRMKPITEVMPKPMVPVVNRPVLEHVVLGLVNAGVDDLLVVVNYKEEQIRAHFGDGARFGARISYLRQDNPSGGTGAAALLGEQFVGDAPFLLTFGDLLISPANYRALVDTYTARPTSGRIMINEVEDPSAGAAVSFDANERMVKIVEKPPRGTAESNWNNSGIFVFSPVVFDALRKTPLSERNEIELTAAIQRLADERGDITVCKLSGLWSDVGTPAKVLELNRTILSDPALGMPVVAGEPSRWPGAQVDSDCAVAEGAEVGRATIREHTCVATGARVADGSLLRASALFPGAEVGIGCRLRHAIVTSGARVPDGETVQGSPEAPAVVY